MRGLKKNYLTICIKKEGCKSLLRLFIRRARYQLLEALGGYNPLVTKFIRFQLAGRYKIPDGFFFDLKLIRNVPNGVNVFNHSTAPLYICPFSLTVLLCGKTSAVKVESRIKKQEGKRKRYPLLGWRSVSKI